VKSTPGHGASFFVDLPLAPASADTAADPSSVPVKTRQLSVLVVDDEPEVAELLADILTADGHRVAIAGSGTEALDKIGQTEFDIVLSDLRMPNLDGPGLYRALQERKAGLAERLAFITGDTMSPKASLFIRSVNRPYLEKPITPQAVRELVRSIVTPRR
jgi:CheY-like chemotaxis protein